MLKRLIYAVVGVVGLALIGLAIASATVWRADDVLRASATADQAIVVTDPGVLEMAGDPVTVTATVPDGGHVVLAVGRDTDVTGWVGADPAQRVTGLADWRTLALATGAGTAAPAGTDAPDSTAAPTGTAAPDEGVTLDGVVTPESVGVLPDAASSDMWVAQAAGDGSAELTWQAQPGRWSLLVVGSTADGTAAFPTVALAWPRTVATPYLVPGTVAGALLLLLALLLVARDLRRSHRGAAQWTPVLTEPVPVVASTGAQQVLTRRQLREIRALAEAGHRVDLPSADEPAPTTSPVPLAVPVGSGAVLGTTAGDELPQADLAAAPRERSVAADEPPAGSPPSVGRRALRRRGSSPEPAQPPAGERSAEPEAGETTASLPAVVVPAGLDELAAPPLTGEWPVVAPQPAPVGAGAVAGGGYRRPMWAPVRRATEPEHAAPADLRVPPPVSDPPRLPNVPVASQDDAGQSEAGAAHEPAWLRPAPSDGPRRRDVREHSTPSWAPAAATPEPGRPAPVAASPSGTAAAAPRAAERPAAAPPTTESPVAAPPVGEPPSPQSESESRLEASRADAWRRAWGMPSLDAEGDEK